MSLFLSPWTFVRRELPLKSKSGNVAVQVNENLKTRMFYV